MSDIKVRDIIRPRVEIDAFDIDTPPEEVVGAVVMSGFSRVPVYEGDLDHIIGFIYNKDLLLRLHMGWPIEVRKLLRPALVVPETMSLAQLVERFRSQKTQMAVVLDEHGGTEGIVTLTDVLEELVGTVYDEHRPAGEPEILPCDETSWLVDGAFGARDLLEAVGRTDLGLALPRHVSTAGGLVQTLMERIPSVGESIAWNGLDFAGRRNAGPQDSADSHYAVEG